MSSRRGASPLALTSPAAVLALTLAFLGGASPAGDPSKQLHIPGLPGQAFLAGSGIDANGDSIVVHPQSGASVVSACHPEWRPEDITQFKLVGKTISFTVDLSAVGCACNLAFYLISAPAKDEQGKPIPGNNDLAPGNFYCDANKVGGQWCPEVDIMEANNHAFASTPHKCDPPSNGHYPSCDRAGCGQNTRDMANAYGPGSSFRIDTTKPFKVVTAFTEHKGALASMVTTLQQGTNRVTMDHGTCQPDYYAALSDAMVSGMSLRITYWGSSASTMSWLDKPPCGEQSCSAGNAGQATISHISISSSTGASASSQAVQMASSAPAPTAPPQTTSLTAAPLPPQTTPAPVLSFDCTEGAPAWEGWTQVKKAWCCSSKRIACDPFNCFEHLEDWTSHWSPQKQAWCCQRKVQGCPQSPGGPNAQQQVGPLRWSNFPTKCFTDSGGPVGNLVIVDCVGPNGGTTQIWQSIGDGSIRLAAEPERCMEVADPNSAQNGGRIQVSRCRPGDLAQQFSINTASMKIQWKAHRHMCLDVANHNTANGTPLQLWKCSPLDDDQVVAWPVVEQSVLASLTTASVTPGTTARPAAAGRTTPFVWEPSEPSLPSLATTTTTIESIPGWSKMLPDDETYTTTTVPDPYTCDVQGLSRTSYKQRVWCCMHKYKGCPVVIPPTWRYEPRDKYPMHTRASPEIDGPRTDHLLHWGDPFRVTEAKVGYDGVLYLRLEGDRGWTFESTPLLGTLCVENLPVPRTTRVPYDCDKDLDQWQVAWSKSQKAWCCTYRERGCASSSSTSLAPPDSAVPTFDCSIGYQHWRSTWTVGQAAFCCSTSGRGCPDDEAKQTHFDCTLWFPDYEQTWPLDQALWCCRHKGRGCPARESPHDCHSGGPASSWPRRKRVWCCSYRSLGCPESGASSDISRQYTQTRHTAALSGRFHHKFLATETGLAAGVACCVLLLGGLVLRRRLQTVLPCPEDCTDDPVAVLEGPLLSVEEVSLLQDTDRPARVDSCE